MWKFVNLVGSEELFTNPLLTERSARRTMALERAVIGASLSTPVVASGNEIRQLLLSRPKTPSALVHTTSLLKR